MDLDALVDSLGTATPYVAGLLPLLVKVGLLVLVVTFLRFAVNFIMDLVFGLPPEPDGSPGFSEGPRHANSPYLCPLCGLRHGPNYKGTHPITE